MPETISPPSPLVFRNQVQQRMAGSAVSAEGSTLRQHEHAVSVRLAGGYLTQVQLVGKGASPVTILYSDPDPDAAVKSKMNASHIMAPVGAYTGLGGQHGIYRWADYRLIHKAPDSFTVQALVPQEYLAVQKKVWLDDRGFGMRTTLTNLTGRAVDTSLGEHLYWWLPEGNSEGLKVVFADALASEPFKDTNLLAAVMAGESHFWLPSLLRCRIYRPDGVVLELESTAEITDGITSHVTPVGMLLWRRPHTESICFEPAIGIETDKMNVPLLTSSVPNHGLRLVAGAQATLETRISVIAST